MAVKKNELTLDELNNIAGGRKFYEEEWDDYYNANNALTSKLRRLKTQGKEAEARQIRQACEDLFNKWMEDVHNSPEGSDPISYRSYIEQYLD